MHRNQHNYVNPDESTEYPKAVLVTLQSYAVLEVFNEKCCVLPSKVIYVLYCPNNQLTNLVKLELLCKTILIALHNSKIVLALSGIINGAESVTISRPSRH